MIVMHVETLKTFCDLVETGSLSRAAKLLGISRPTLYDLMRHHNLKARAHAETRQP